LFIQTIVGRVIVLYILLGLGFFFYLSRVPERFKPGKKNERTLSSLYD
jgi:hypothetical protein